MAPTASSQSKSSSAKAAGRPRRSGGKTALRWFVGVCSFALLAGATQYVGAAFADLGRVDAQSRALVASLREANAAAGANLGPQWTALIETPAGQRALIGWFEALDRAWPSACATEMLSIGQTAAACLPVPQTLGPLVDARLGANAYAALSALRAAPPEPAMAPQAAPEPVEAVSEEMSAPVMSRSPAALDAASAAAAEPSIVTVAAALDDGSAFEPPTQAEAAPMSDEAPFEGQAEPAMEAEALVSPPGFEPGTY